MGKKVVIKAESIQSMMDQGPILITMHLGEEYFVLNKEWILIGDDVICVLICAQEKKKLKLLPLAGIKSITNINECRP